MAIDTKPNFSYKKFEQCATDIMNLSGCTQIYGMFDIETGATLTICDNAGLGKVLTSNATGVASWQDAATGGITSISGGSGMNFSPITTTGEIVLGTPSAILNTSTNISSGTTHNHVFSASTFVSGTQGILVDGNNRFYLDDTYISSAVLPNLHTINGVNSNQSLGNLPSGQTLGMVYITNNGSASASVNLGTTPTGNDITPFEAISVGVGEDVSITVNMRLSISAETTIYINSADWTNVDLDVQWAHISYKNVPLPTGGTYTFVGSGGTQVFENGNEITIYSETGGTGGLTTASNGLITSGSDVKLGGTLTENTNIISSGKGFSIGNYVYAVGANSFAFGNGYNSGYNICSTGNGSFAVGYIGYYGNITASGNGSFAVGISGNYGGHHAAAEGSALVGGYNNCVHTTGVASGILGGAENCVFAPRAAIVGGCRSSLAINNDFSVILGGNNVDVGDGCLPDHAIVPNLAIFNTPLTDNNGCVLVWDSVTKKVGVTTITGSSGGSGTVTSVAAGNGLDFTTFTTSGSVVMGTPSSVSSSSTNSVTSTSHSHNFDVSSIVGGNDGAMQYNNGGSFGGTCLNYDDSLNHFGWGIAATGSSMMAILSDKNYDFCNTIMEFYSADSTPQFRVNICDNSKGSEMHVTDIHGYGETGFGRLGLNCGTTQCIDIGAISILCNTIKPRLGGQVLIQDIHLSTLSNSTTSNVLYYNTGTCAVTYGTNAAACGSDGSIQYNNGGTLGGSPFYYDDSINRFGFFNTGDTNTLLSLKTSTDLSYDTPYYYMKVINEDNTEQLVLCNNGGSTYLKVDNIGSLCATSQLLLDSNCYISSTNMYVGESTKCYNTKAIYNASMDDNLTFGSLCNRTTSGLQQTYDSLTTLFGEIGTSSTTELSGASGSRLVLANASVFYFKIITQVERSVNFQDNHYSIFKTEGAIKYYSATAFGFVGTPTTTVIGEDNIGDHSVSVTADSTNKALKIEVTNNNATYSALATAMVELIQHRG